MSNRFIFQTLWGPGTVELDNTSCRETAVATLFIDGSLIMLIFPNYLGIADESSRFNKASGPTENYVF